MRDNNTMPIYKKITYLMLMTLFYIVIAYSFYIEGEYVAVGIVWSTGTIVTFIIYLMMFRMGKSRVLELFMKLF